MIASIYLQTYAIVSNKDSHGEKGIEFCFRFLKRFQFLVSGKQLLLRMLVGVVVVMVITMVMVIEHLLSTYYIPGSVLTSLPALANLILIQSYDLGTFIIPILEMRQDHRF